MMARRWMVVALFCLGLIAPGQALAQLPPGIGGAEGPAGPGEPTPIQTMPGFNPAAGPEKDLTGAPPIALTNDGTPNAFVREDCVRTDCGVFASVGPMALMRQGLGNLVLGVEDPNNNGHTGLRPPLDLPALLDPSDVGTSYMWGVRASVGYRYGGDSIEFAGFYLPKNVSTYDLLDPGRIDLAFGAFNAPPGFGGNNNLFLQADSVTMKFQTTLGGFETNYRVATGSGWEWILGVHYYDMDERFTMQIFDDQVLGNNIPKDNATYVARAHSRILGPQIGAEGEWPIASWIACGGMIKATEGINFASVDTELYRGDGFYSPQRPTVHSFHTQFGHAYEANMFLDFILTDQIKIRGGYQALFLVNVPEATDQIDFNLLDLQGRRSNTGSVFYHGPIIELQIMF